MTTHGVQRRLIDQVRQVRAAHPGCTAGHHLEAHRRVERFALRVNLEDWQALVEVGQRNDDLAVEAAGAQQRRVQHVRSVRRGDDHDAFGGVKAVHLVQHLVQGLLTFVVTAAHAGTAFASNGVDLVNEDDRRRLLARGREEVADAARPDPDEHLHEVGSRDREEGYARLTRDRTGQHGLAGARGSDEQDALGDHGADLLVPRGRLQEFDNLADLLLDPEIPGHVGECRRRPVLVELLGLGAAHGHHPVHLALRLTIREDEESHEDEDPDQVRQER